MRKVFLVPLVIVVLFGCASGPSMTIQQQKDVSQAVTNHSLKKGMTMDEVRILMGEPQIINKPPLRPSTATWTYTSHNIATQTIIDMTTQITSKPIRILFKDGKLFEAWIGQRVEWIGEKEENFLVR